MRTTIGLVDNSQMTGLVGELSHRLMVNSESVLPFLELDDCVPELLKLLAHGRQHLVCGGHVTPDLLIAADRAEMRVHETLSASPFTLDAMTIKSAITSPADILYVANPNRVTGANLGMPDLTYLAEAVRDGFLIIDEYYYEYYGISGVALLEKFSNVIVLRSFTASYGIGSAESGFVVASPTIIEHLAERLGAAQISTSKYEALQATLHNDQSMSMRLRMLHDEMLRVSTVLTRLGIQNRITAADYLLLRVSNPAAVGNYLATHRIPFDNLDGYPQLKNYIRYKVQSEVNNDELLRAFEKMPADNYRMVGVDSRTVTLRRSGDAAPFQRTPVRSGLTERLHNRSTRITQAVTK